ncbi:MAG TPA: hypothetical protein V6C97_08145 [Oculatellaceae cyanobacterium]
MDWSRFYAYVVGLFYQALPAAVIFSSPFLVALILLEILQFKFKPFAFLASHSFFLQTTALSLVMILWAAISMSSRSSLIHYPEWHLYILDIAGAAIILLIIAQFWVFSANKLSLSLP